MNDFQKNDVFEALRERAPRALHLAEICAHLGIAKQRRDEVREALDQLRDLGLVKEMPGQRFRLAGDARKGERTLRQVEEERAAAELNGRLAMHPKGYGFVTADDGGADVFVPPGSIGGALHGDRVQVRVRRSPKGREGQVVTVLERGLLRVSGILRQSGRSTWIEPDDPRMRGPMPVAGADPLPADARPGIHVVAEIVHYPRGEDEAAEVKVIAALGKKGVTAVEVAKIKIREGVVEEFPADVIAEAKAFAEHVREEEKQGRDDLRDVPLVTIDPVDARDHDDAIWGEKLERGGFRVIVAIADVSHYVREGTAIDREALARATSIYLPDRAIPMLPRELSSNLASLVPHQDRLCLAVDIELDAQGNVVHHEYKDAVMRSRARLSYGAVAAALGLTDQTDADPEAERRLPMLRVLHECAQVLRQRRLDRGALDFDLPEAKVVLDPDSEPRDVVRARKDPGVRKAYQLVEEMMLLANEVVAQDFSRRNIPAIYRVHGAPDEEKIAKFAELASSLGYVLDPEAATKPKKLVQFLKRIEGTPHQHALGYLLLRAMQQATYDPNNIGHFGLAAPDYVHFTSPIRRYPDLTVHRTLRAMIQGKRYDFREARSKLQYQAIESSRLERRAMSVERDVVDLYRAILMRDHVGETREATITGIAGFGFFATFDKPFVEGMCPVEALGDDFYEMDDLGLRLVGGRSGRAYALGDRITVRIEDVSIETRRVTVVPADQPEGARPLPRAPKEHERRQGVMAHPKQGQRPERPGERRGGSRVGANAKPGGKPGRGRDERSSGGRKGSGPKRGGPKRGKRR